MEAQDRNKTQQSALPDVVMQRHSQYNPYTLNPRQYKDETSVESQQQTSGPVDPRGEPDDYVSPSAILSNVLITSNENPADLTMLVKPSEEQQREDSSYLYEQAIPATGAGEDDFPSHSPDAPPDYVNSNAVKEILNPQYVNGAFAESLEDGPKKHSARSRVPVPVPRESKSPKPPLLDRAPSGLYVEEVDVGDDDSSNIQYVIPELEPHYSN